MTHRPAFFCLSRSAGRGGGAAAAAGGGGCFSTPPPTKTNKMASSPFPPDGSRMQSGADEGEREREVGMLSSAPVHLFTCVPSVVEVVFRSFT